MWDKLVKHNWIFWVGDIMENFLGQYGGFIIGFLFMPACSIIRTLIIDKLIDEALEKSNTSNRRE